MNRPDPDLAAIGRALRMPGPPSSDFDLNPEMRASLPADRRLRPASVLVPLIRRPAGLQVLLTKRPAAMRQHPGQVAFPGGKMEPGDRDLCHTALREAEEEVALRAEDVEILGQLQPHETVTAYRVTPFVGLVRGPFVPRPDPSEVDEAFEVPLAYLLDPASLQVHRRLWQGRPRQYLALPWGPYYIWGATARMLKSLADRMEAT